MVSVFPRFPVITNADKNAALIQAFRMGSYFLSYLNALTLKFLEFLICLRPCFHMSADSGMLWYLCLYLFKEIKTSKTKQTKNIRDAIIYCISSSFCLVNTSENASAICLNI